MNQHILATRIRKYKWWPPGTGIFAGLLLWVTPLHADYSVWLSTTNNLSDIVIALTSATKQLVEMSTVNYINGYANGMVDERYHDVTGLSTDRYYCANSSTSVVYSTTTRLDLFTCNWVLDTVIDWITMQSSAPIYSPPPPPPPLLGDTTTSLIYYAKLDEGAGSIVRDYSVNANTVTLSGLFLWEMGHSSGAILLDGNTGMGKAVSTTGLNISSGTLAAWVNPTVTASSYRAVISKGTLSKAGWGMSLQNGFLNLIEINVTDLTSTVSVSTGTWQHAAITWNGPVVKFYKNGVLAQTITTASPVIPPADADPFYLGAFVGTNTFSGGLDEIRVYNRVLTDTDIATLYAL